MVPTARGRQGILKSHRKSGKMERVSEKSGNFKSTTLQKLKSIQNNKKNFIVIKLINIIIHIRYSVHSIHTPLWSETVWYQPLCMVYLVSHVKKLVGENHSFCWEKSENEFCKLVGTMGLWCLDLGG